MDGKQGRHESAGPEIRRHPPQNEEEEDCRGTVQENIGEMITPRLKTIDLIVQQQRKPSQRIPEVAVGGRKRPADPRGRQTVSQRGIFGQMHGIIVADERVADRLAKDECDRQHEQAADGQHGTEATGAGRVFFGSLTHGKADFRYEVPDSYKRIWA